MSNLEDIIKKINLLPKSNKEKKIYGKGDYWRDNWSQDVYLAYCSQDPKSRIIVEYVKVKKIYFENYEQASGFFQRNNRAIKDLACYSLDRIKGVMDYLSKKADYKWTLETVLKFIDEPMEKLTGQEPIIILSNGERIYDIERLKNLEQSGRIYWDNSKWRERC
jgi:hypothetical protein